MKVIKFTINENYYNELKSKCEENDLTVKRKINVLVSQDTAYTDYEDINEYFPEDSKENVKKVTLKVNEELYKGIMKNCGKLDLRTNKYIPYLIYRYLREDKN